MPMSYELWINDEEKQLKHLGMILYMVKAQY